MIQNKLFIAVALSIVFFILSMPMAYTESDKVLRSLKIRTTFDTRQGIPTTIGLILHAVLFFVIALGILLLKLPSKEIEQPEKHIDKPEHVVKL